MARNVQRCLFRFTSIFTESHGSQSRWFGFLVSHPACFVFHQTPRFASCFYIYILRLTREHATLEEKSIHVFHERAKREPTVFLETTRKTSIRFIFAYSEYEHRFKFPLEMGFLIQLNPKIFDIFRFNNSTSQQNWFERTVCQNSIISLIIFKTRYIREMLN